MQNASHTARTTQKLQQQTIPDQTFEAVAAAAPALAAAPPSLLPPTLLLQGLIPIDLVLLFGGLRVAEGRVAEKYRRLGS
jgi:hypothetical protein